MATDTPYRNVTRVNTAADGTQAIGGTIGTFSFSPDGTHILFASDAPNLVPGDTNGDTDLFLKNLATGAITRVNTAANGDQADRPEYQ
jgi:Tol biopolymer transport system component